MPSRDLQDGSSPASLLQGRFLAQAAGAAPALAGPDPLYAEGRRGRPQTPRAPAHCDVTLWDPGPRGMCCVSVLGSF